MDRHARMDRATAPDVHQGRLDLAREHLFVTLTAAKRASPRASERGRRKLAYLIALAATALHLKLHRVAAPCI